MLPIITGSRNLHKKSSEVSIKTGSMPDSLSFEGQVTVAHKRKMVDHVTCKNFGTFEKWAPAFFPSLIVQSDDFKWNALLTHYKATNSSPNFLNRVNCYDAGAPQSPFGGFKMSGQGREWYVNIILVSVKKKNSWDNSNLQSTLSLRLLVTVCCK